MLSPFPGMDSYRFGLGFSFVAGEQTATLSHVGFLDGCRENRQRLDHPQIQSSGLLKS
jgi:hypothetical protein